MLKSGTVLTLAFDSSDRADNAHLVTLYLGFFSTIPLFYQWQQQEAENAV